jgi:hypothetical protein
VSSIPVINRVTGLRPTRTARCHGNRPSTRAALVSQSQMERIAGASVNGASRYIATIVLTTLKCEMRSSLLPWPYVSAIDNRRDMIVRVVVVFVEGDNQQAGVSFCPFRVCR